MPRRQRPKGQSQRADQVLSQRGFAESQQKGAALIMAGSVLVTESDGKERKVEKPGELLGAQVQFRLKGEARPYVSRGGLKLEAALNQFDVQVQGRVALDLGISTGGFTDCLLQRGAARVHGVDVGYGVVDWRLRSDTRLILHERTNVRDLTYEYLGETADLVVMDLSFIGLSAVWPVLSPLLSKEADLIALIKPQFELPKHRIEQGGLVTDPEARAEALSRAVEGAARVGLRLLESIDCPVPGARGNVELLGHFRWHHGSNADPG